MEKLQKTSGFQVAEISISYEPKVKASERYQITSSKHAYEILYNSWNHHLIELQEQFKILILNRANKVLGVFEVSTGGVSGTYVDPKLVFSTALIAAGTTLILAHNHPSGNLKPSEQDLKITRKLKEGGKLLDIEIIEHLIITNEGYYSFADEGLI